MNLSNTSLYETIKQHISLWICQTTNLSMNSSNNKSMNLFNKPVIHVKTVSIWLLSCSSWTDLEPATVLYSLRTLATPVCTKSVVCSSVLIHNPPLFAHKQFVCSYLLIHNYLCILPPYTFYLSKSVIFPSSCWSSCLSTAFML